jgi:hypothetical protein
VSKNLPPDDGQQALAKIVNEALRPFATVALYRIQDDDGKIIEAMVSAAGSRRAVHKFQNPRTVDDAKEIIEAVQEWIGRPRVADRYSQNPEDGQSPDWRTMS